MQALRVDIAGMRAMAARWDASVGELSAAVPPAGLGAPGQASAAAVDAAHLDVAAFSGSLAARVSGHSTNVEAADADYVADEVEAVDEMAAVATRVIGV